MPGYVTAQNITIVNENRAAQTFNSLS